MIGRLILAAALLAAPAFARPLDEIKTSGELRICFVPLHASLVVAEPEGCTTDCTFSGPAADHAAAFADTLPGVRPVYRAIRWDQQFWNAQGQTVREAEYTPALLADGTCDLYPNNVTRIAWRETKLAIVPYFRSRMMVIVGQGAKEAIRAPGDLAGRMAAAEPGTSYLTWLEQANADTYSEAPVQITQMPLKEALKAVESGAQDFTLLDADMAIWTVRNQLKNAAVAFPVGPQDEIGWAMRREDLDLQQAVTDFFAAQRGDATSEFNRIWQRHFGISLSKFEKLIDTLPE